MSDLDAALTSEQGKHDSIWNDDDKLERRADADFLIHFLTRRIEERGALGEKKSYVLNIDAGWGGGKTFFLERFGQQLEAEGHLVTSVNAWEDDHVEDPLIAVMAAIETAIKGKLEEGGSLAEDWSKLIRKAGGIVFRVGVKFVQHQVDKHFGSESVELVEAGVKSIKEPSNHFADIVDNFQKEKQGIHEFREELEEFLAKLKGVKKPLFILVDEMDRCRPPYAIALLERVKHLFSINNVVFVFATDTLQLSHSITAVYGERFDGRGYLHRFFDQTYRFADLSKLEFVQELCLRFGLNNDSVELPDAVSPAGGLSEFLTNGFEEFGMELRDVLQCMDHLRNIVSSWPYDGHRPHVILMLPLIIAFHRGLPLLKTYDLAGEVARLSNIAEYTDGTHDHRRARWQFEYSKGNGNGIVIVSWDKLFSSYLSLSFKEEKDVINRLNQSLESWEREVHQNILEDYKKGRYHFGKRRKRFRSKDLVFRKYIDAVATAGRLLTS